jgi:hypothetical protein
MLTQIMRGSGESNSGAKKWYKRPLGGAQSERLKIDYSPRAAQRSDELLAAKSNERTRAG